MINTLVEDTVQNLKTTTLLRGLNITTYEKNVVLKVLKHLSSNSNSNNEFNTLVKKVNSYDELINNIQGCKTPECLFSNAILTYHVKPKCLLMDTIAIHSRVMPLESKDEWYDNFTLNSYLLQLTTIRYKNFDTNEDEVIYSINEPEGTIIKNVKLTNPKDLLFHLGNEYRIFLETGKEFKEINTDEEALEVLDKINKKYCYSTGCTHGCDVFWLPDKSVGIKDISEFCKRYPNHVVGYILNTKSYASGRGQHWLAFLFKNNKCYLICSQGSDFNSFDVSEKINKELAENGFGTLWNLETIQHDNSSCGMYSVLSNLCFLITGDLRKTIEMIGKNANGIQKGGIYKIKEILTGFNN